MNTVNNDNASKRPPPILSGSLISLTRANFAEMFSKVNKDLGARLEGATEGLAKEL